MGAVGRRDDARIAVLAIVDDIGCHQASAIEGEKNVHRMLSQSSSSAVSDQKVIDVRSVPGLMLRTSRPSAAAIRTGTALPI